MLEYSNNRRQIPVIVEPPGQGRGSTASSLDFARDDPEQGLLGQGPGPRRGVEGGKITIGFGGT